MSSRADHKGPLLVNALSRAYAWVARIARAGARFVSWAWHARENRPNWAAMFHATETDADRAMLGNCRRTPDGGQGSSSHGECEIPMMVTPARAPQAREALCITRSIRMG